MKKLNQKSFLYVCLLFCCLLLLCSSPVIAASRTTTTTSAKATTPTYKKRWVKNKQGFYTYYNEKGKKVKGFVTIKNKKFFFDSKGVQRNGWQKINQHYYYFRISKGTNAYMLSNTSINGIKLRKNGSAILNTTAKKNKMKILYNAQQKSQTIIKNNSLTKAQKLRLLYDWTQKNENIRKNNIGGFRSSIKNWDVYYAGLVLNVTYSPARGDCYTYASAFGYLANAIGYSVTVCSSGGHGYVRIGNRFYDPSWQKATTTNLFACGWDSIAPGLNLRYRTNMRYTRVI